MADLGAVGTHASGTVGLGQPGAVASGGVSSMAPPLMHYATRALGELQRGGGGSSPVSAMFGAAWQPTGTLTGKVGA